MQAAQADVGMVTGLFFLFFHIRRTSPLRILKNKECN